MNYFWNEYEISESLRHKAWIEEKDDKLVALLIKDSGETETKYFPTKEEFDTWYNKTTDWKGISRIHLTVGGKELDTSSQLISNLIPKTPAISHSESSIKPTSVIPERPLPFPDLKPKLDSSIELKEQEPLEYELSKLVKDIKEFKPKWEIRTDRWHQGRLRNLIGEEKGTSRNLSDFLVRKGWDSKVEVSIPSYGIADILIRDKYIVEAKVHIAEPGPRRDLGAKVRRLKGKKYQLIIVIYMGYLPSHFQELQKELGGTKVEIIPFSDWYSNRRW